MTNSLEPIWAGDRPHIEIAEVRDWFASYVYLPRLRDEATLDGALQRLVEDLATPYAYASSFDEDAGIYQGVIDGKAVLPGVLADGLIVRNEAIRTGRTEPAAEGTGGNSGPVQGGASTAEQAKGDLPSADPLPERFFASIAIEPERAGLEVARIMDGLLVELTRTSGSTLRLTLEIDGRAGDSGYPKDVIETVSANVRDLKLDADAVGFEEE